MGEKKWEGCGGLTITEEIKVTVAAQLSILVLGFQQQYFDNVLTILVYPDVYVAPGKTMTGAGVVVEGKSAREGEAWYRGPVILSWADVLSSGRGQRRGHNLVLHEFAHQLDMMNGRDADGVPRMESPDQATRWITTLKAEYERLCHGCRHRGRPIIDCYGTTNLAEFFAVATELFFECPREFRYRHGQLFSLFREYFRQDPSRRFEPD